MRGYRVVTSGDRTVGRVAEVQDRYVIVESGLLRRSRRPVPKEFVHLRNGQRKVFVTVPKSVLDDAPHARRDGSFDVEEAARHYGLAESFREPKTAWAEETSEHRAAEIRRQLSRENAPDEAGAAPLTKRLPGEPPRKPERGDFYPGSS